MRSGERAGEVRAFSMLETEALELVARREEEEEDAMGPSGLPARTLWELLPVTRGLFEVRFSERGALSGPRSRL